MEDENLNLLFKVASLKDKTFQQAKELQEMKLLVKKLYKKYRDKKTKGSGSLQSSPDSMGHRIALIGEISMSANSDDLSVQSPRSAETPSPPYASSTLTSQASTENPQSSIEPKELAGKKSLFSKASNEIQQPLKLRVETDRVTFTEPVSDSSSLKLPSEPLEIRKETDSSIIEESKDSNIPDEKTSIAHFFATSRHSLKHGTTINLDAPRLSSTGQALENGECKWHSFINSWPHFLFIERFSPISFLFQIQSF